MYLGHIVEVMNAEEIYTNPVHPYTKALLSAVPITDYYVEKSRNRILLEGEVPSPIHAPSGCPFHPRCPYATEQCRKEVPLLKNMGNGHFAACHHV
jgi:peptide/nickel transport system ATP-binding protein/oligopeptide transport system ATP-binding protein